jgi:hypothetical protein
VAGIGDQGERLRQQAAGELDQHEHRGQRERRAEYAAAGACGVVVIVTAVIMDVIMGMGVSMSMVVSAVDSMVMVSLFAGPGVVAAGFVARFV